jgi:uncharacterized protein (DUF3084 family)
MNTIDSLKKQQVEYEKCTATVYDPKTMDISESGYEQLKYKYIDLTKKLEQIEQEKNQEIDRLINTMAQANKEIQSCKQDNYNLKSRNIDLERIIEKQNLVISMAAGYISSTPQFSNYHPINVKKWLMGGME